MKLSKQEVAEMPPTEYQAQVVAWSKGRDIPTQEDLAQAEKMAARWNVVRLARKQKPLI